MKGAKHMNTMEKRSNVTTLKIAVFFFLVGCSARLFVSSTAQAALLTVGRPGSTPCGGQVCADVRSASITPGIAVQDYDCFGDLNEQFELFGLKIYLGNTRCLDVFGIRSYPTHAQALLARSGTTSMGRS
jgi:hypothetical protein